MKLHGHGFRAIPPWVARHREIGISPILFKNSVTSCERRALAFMVGHFPQFIGTVRIRRISLAGPQWAIVSAINSNQ
jgi:hypothetical protein